MDECLNVLSQNKGYQHDEQFVHQVRLQLIAGEIETAKGVTTVPPAFYLKALQLRVEGVKANISPQLQTDGEFSSSSHIKSRD